MEKHPKETDFISQLPDDLLIRILSLLPEADATRSRFLSNRWKYLWAFLPNLQFVMPKFKEQTDKFNDSVDQILALRGGMHIQKFYLQCNYSNIDDRVNNWLHIATQCKVDELDFRFQDRMFITFNFDLFRTCSYKLSKLTFEGSYVLLNPEVEILFPCLKKLNLQCMNFLYENFLTNLISQCPVLEELCLDRLQLTCKSHIVKLSCKSMRRLTIKRINCKDLRLVIDAPKLEYLYFSNCLFSDYILMSPTSLVETHITNTSYGYVINILRCLSTTKILTLTCESLLDPRRNWYIDLPMFPNLIKLEFAWEWSLLLDLLNIMPNLEYLSFPDGFVSFTTEWNPQREEAPACLRFKLKQIFIGSCATLKDFGIISYLLKHANILEKLTISEDDPERCEQWLIIHRVSKSCRIEFV